METNVHVVSIDFHRIRKGDVISSEQVEHHYIEHIVGRENYDTKVAEYERGERVQVVWVGERYET